VVFRFTEFPLRQQISCLFYFPHLRYFVAHEHTLGNLEVIIYFQKGNTKISFYANESEVKRAFLADQPMIFLVYKESYLNLDETN
jgi:hypothetical protein